MALAPLASASDLGALGIDTTDASLTDLMLNAASSAVREAAGVAISRTSSTFAVQGTGGQWLDLPALPVIEVSSVEIDGSPVSDWKLVGGSLWRLRGWAICEPSVVSIEATAGFDPVPPDIVLLVAELAAAGINAAAEGAVEAKLGIQSERIDDYSVTYATGDGTAGFSLDLPVRLRDSLRQRFGAGAHVTSPR